MKEEGHMMTDAGIEVQQLQVKEYQESLANHQKLGRGQEEFSSTGFRDSMTLPTRWFWTFSLQDYEAVNVLF